MVYGPDGLISGCNFRRPSGEPIEEPERPDQDRSQLKDDTGPGVTDQPGFAIGDDESEEDSHPKAPDLAHPAFEEERNVWDR